MGLPVKDGNGQAGSIKTTSMTGGHVPHHLPESEFLLRAAQGKATGVTPVYLYGENAGVDTAIEDLSGTAAVVALPAAAAAISVVSSSANDAAAGTGARTVLLVGLSSTYALASETVTLNGTTPVASVSNYLRVLSATVQTAGSGGVNAGEITLSISAVEQMRIVAGYNITTAAAYTIPVGKTGYLQSWRGAATVADGLAVSLWIRPFGGVYQLRTRLPVHQDPDREDFGYSISLPEKSDLVVRAQRLSGSGAVLASGALRLLLVDSTVQ